MSDKRKWPRKASLAPCRVELFSMQENPRSSRVVNYSLGGLMLELDNPLVTGEPVKISFSHSTTQEQADRHSYCLGVVRWCARQEGGYSAMYGIGVEMSPSATRQCIAAVV